MKKLLTLLLALVIGLSVIACGGTNDDPFATRPEWGSNFRAPAYMGGVVTDRYYYTGAGEEFVFDSKAKDNDRMQVVTNTSAKQFKNYQKKLEANGYKQVFSNEVNSNLYAQYQKEGTLVYVSYTPAFKEAKIIEDNRSIPLNTISYDYEVKESDTSVIYQFGLMNDPVGGNGTQTAVSKYGDNGMFYIFKLADNSVILLDGGSGIQATDRATEELVDFLFNITGTPKEDKVRVSALLITHAHGDHKTFPQKLIQNYADKFEFERTLYNIPSAVISSTSFKNFGNLIKEKYPNIKYAKVHTGTKIELANAKIEVVLTHEELIDPLRGVTLIGDLNDSSTLFKITLDDMTMMVLADIGGGGSVHEEKYQEFIDRIMPPYKTEKTYDFLKCDIVQVAHHALNYDLPKIYNAVGAKIALVPQADCEYNLYAKGNYRKVIDQVIAAGGQELYFQNRATWALSKDATGKITANRLPIYGVDDGYMELIAQYAPYSGK